MSYYEIPRPKKPIWREGWVKAAITYTRTDWKKQFVTFKGAMSGLLIKLSASSWTLLNNAILMWFDDFVWAGLVIFTIVQISKTRTANYEDDLEAWEEANKKAAEKVTLKLEVIAVAKNRGLNLDGINLDNATSDGLRDFLDKARSVNYQSR